MPAVVMTPNVATPAMFQHSMPPWVTQTPEASPMMWGCAPASNCYNVYLPAPAVPTPNAISKEFIRSVCQPHFEQMLMAVSQAVQVQVQIQQGLSLQEPCRSTEGSGAFSAIFTPTHEELQRATNGPRSFAYGAEAFSKTSPAESTLAESDGAGRQRQDLESDTTSESVPEQSGMICRHWKSKGWCRMEENCKFSHPDDGRGAGFVDGAKTAGRTKVTSGRDQNNHPADQLAPSSADTSSKNKSITNRKNKASPKP